MGGCKCGREKMLHGVVCVNKVHAWAPVDGGGPQIALKISPGQEGNTINYEVTASIKLKFSNEQLFPELGPENPLVYMVLNSVPTILFQ